MGDVDYLIVGQGIAGTALAWALLEHGASVLVVDRNDPDCASRVAAGLITPLGGKRVTPEPLFSQFRDIASKHYKDIEQLSGRRLFSSADALRVLRSGQEREALARHSNQLAGIVSEPDPAPAAAIVARHGIVQVHGTARLDTSGYLDASRSLLCAGDAFIEAQIDSSSLRFERDLVHLNDNALCASNVVFCAGYADAANRWLPTNGFEAAKGETLTVRITGFDEPRTVHGVGIWLAATTSPGEYRVGATYDRDNLDGRVSAAARTDLAERLAGLISLPFDIVGQHAAVRPIGAGRLPLLGRNPHQPRVAFFNGLGSKGALRAPALAVALAAHLLDDASLSDSLLGALHTNRSN